MKKFKRISLLSFSLSFIGLLVIFLLVYFTSFNNPAFSSSINPPKFKVEIWGGRSACFGCYEQKEVSEDSTPVNASRNKYYEISEGWASEEAFAVSQRGSITAFARSESHHGLGYEEHPASGAVAEFVLRDIIFTAPESQIEYVTTKLNLNLTGVFETFISDLPEETTDEWDSTAKAKIKIGIQNYHYSWADILVSYRPVSTINPDIKICGDVGLASPECGYIVPGGVPNLVVNRNYLDGLEIGDFGYDGRYKVSSIISTEEFDVRVGVPITLGVSLRIDTFGYTGLAQDQSTSSIIQISLPALDIFDLPGGYSVNSEDGNIVDNEWRFFPAILETKLTASDPDWKREFGKAVAKSGDVVVVGDRNSAYVFRYDGNGWAQEAKLTPFDPEENDYFGRSVAISGDRIVVGAHGKPWPELYGAAYVFRYVGNGWTQEAKLTASDKQAGDHFGYAVAIHGDTIIIGAKYDDDAGINSGSAYVFRYNGVNWIEETKLLANDAAEGDAFGNSLAINGDSVIVGAECDDNNTFEDAGSAYVFSYVGGAGWSQDAKLTASDAKEWGYFGGSVAISEDTVVVGTYEDDDKNEDAGAVYVFRDNGMDWVQEAKLFASDPSWHAYFGWSVAINGNTIVVGSWGNPDPSQYGAAYVLNYDGTSWSQEVKLTASDAGPLDCLGASVAISGDTVVVGAPLDDNEGGTDAGSAYIYKFTNTTPVGINVVILPLDLATGTYPVTLTFSEVTQAGTTYMSTSADGPSPPSGFMLGDPPTYYELTTTALYSPPIQICIDYSGISYSDENQLKLYHYENGEWVEIPTSLNTENKIICGSVNSLSPFAVLEPGKDVTPPEISVSLSQSTLWPPNHKMVAISASVMVTDDYDPNPQVILTSIVNSEPDDAPGKGDGNTINDIQGAAIGTEDYEFYLRAERDGGGSGRIYTVTYTATDASGNSSSATATVTVPHDQGKGKKKKKK